MVEHAFVVPVAELEPRTRRNTPSRVQIQNVEWFSCHANEHTREHGIF
jgi:hypothetical protein